MAFGTTGYIQFGTSSGDIAYDITTDSSGNLYVTGSTSGSFPSNSNLGGGDAFVAKYDASGTQLWVKQFGSSSDDVAYDITTDSSGNLYVTGVTSGSLPGYTNSGLNDAFIAKYDANGTQLWTKQFGSSSYDTAYGVSTDSRGDVYVTGYANGSLVGNNNLAYGGIFVAKYNASGTQVWTKQFGASSDSARGISIDNSGIYVTGQTGASLPGNNNLGNGDAFVARYSSNGTQVWVKQFGTSSFDDATAISTDGNGNVYVTGWTQGSLPGNSKLGFDDAFVAKYDANGNQLWIKQFGSSMNDHAEAISTDSNGNVYIAGSNDFDPFLAKFNANGTQLWVKSFTSSRPGGYPSTNYGISTDSNGNVYVTSYTSGSLPGNSNLGNADAFIVGFDSNGNLLNTANTSSTLSINDVTLTEGNNGIANATFTVTLSNPVNNIINVDYATANNTAIAESDYLATSGTLTFNANETTKTITVQVNGDNQVELNESFFLNLSNLQTNGSNVTLTDNQGQATITNDDAATISINDVTVTEGNNGTTNAVFTVSLSNAVDTAITLNYATDNGTSTTSDNDYLAINSTPLTFNAGETSKTITVQINGDTKAESNENFFVNLSNLQTNSRDVTLGDNQGQATITNDDSNNILGTLGKDTLTGTSQDDIITGLQGADILRGNGGKDQFVYQNIRDIGDVIKDFEIGQDNIVLTALLKSFNYTGSNPIADSYLKFGARGNDAVILIDEDGNGSKRASPFITVENTAVSVMQNPNNFVF